MADEDDKVRRNLVVVSGLILAGAFLELPASGLLDLFAKTNTLSEVPQSKFWAIGFALLAYLTARYRFSSEGRLLGGELDSTFSQMYLDALRADIQRSEVVFNRTGRVLPFISGVNDVVVHVGKVNGLEPGIPYKSTISFEFNSNFYLNTLEVNLVPTLTIGSGDNVRVIGGHDHKFKAVWPIPRYLTLLTWSGLKASVYSEVALQKIVPLALAGLALIHLLIKVLGSYIRMF